MKRVIILAVSIFSAVHLFAQMDTTSGKFKRLRIGFSSSFLIIDRSTLNPPASFFLIPEVSIGKSNVVILGVTLVPIVHNLGASNFGMGVQVGYEHLLSRNENKLKSFANIGVHLAYEQYKDNINLILPNTQIYSPANITEETTQFGMALGYGFSLECTKRFSISQSINIVYRIIARFDERNVLNYPEYSYIFGTTNILTPTSSGKWLPMLKFGISYAL